MPIFDPAIFDPAIFDCGVLPSGSVIGNSNVKGSDYRLRRKCELLMLMRMYLELKHR